MSRPKTVAVVGGGLSGMTAALEYKKHSPQDNVVLLEAAPRLGGVLKTESVGGYRIEHSADMFTTDPPDALQLCRELGHEADLIETRPVRDRAFVATENGIHPVPSGFSLMLPNNIEAVLQSKLLSATAKERFLQEERQPRPTSTDDESLESFVTRRFGQDVFDRLIQPLVSGIYTADPKKLSMKATLSRFLDMETQHGSLIAAAKSKNKSREEQNASGARYGLFRAPADGMQSLVDWVTAELEFQQVETRLQTQVVGLNPAEHSKWILELALSNGRESLTVDGIVLATPTKTAGILLKPVQANLAQMLQTISAASIAIVVLGFDRQQLKTETTAFGIVVPSILKRDIIATSFSSNKFEHRAPEAKVLTRTFIGGALREDLVEQDDKSLINTAVKELDRMVGVVGSAELARVYRWRQCMPQYHLGHTHRIESIDQAVNAMNGLELAGNSYRGVGIPVCVREGRLAAQRLVSSLAERP